MLKLLVLVVVAVAYSQAAGGCKYSLYKFGHCTGDSMETIHNQPHRVCREACDSKPECRGYYFKVDNGAGGRTMYCTLKTRMCAHPQGEGRRQMGRMWAKGACQGSPIPVIAIEPPTRPIRPVVAPIPTSSYCITSEGKEIPEGDEFTDRCSTYKCTSSGQKLIKAECEDAKGNCLAAGSSGFSCVADNTIYDNCSCGVDRNGDVYYNYVY